MKYVQRFIVLTLIILLFMGYVTAVTFGFEWLRDLQTAGASSAAPKPVYITVPQPVRPETIKGIPSSIKIESLGIDIPVRPGEYNTTTGKWTISDDAAYYGIMTTPANNESGNTFIYGHNSKAIFGKLPRLTLGDTAEVGTDTGAVFTYVFSGSERVQPEDVRALEYQGPPRLTLQTCSGLFNETRSMFYFTLKSYR